MFENEFSKHVLAAGIALHNIRPEELSDQRFKRGRIVAGNKKVVRYRRPFHLNIGLIIFGIIFIYVMFYVYSYFTSTHTSAYEVIHGTIAVNNSYTGLALRTEEIITAEHSGSINYYMKDSTKAGVGDLIYSIDTDGSIANQIQSASEDGASLNGESLALLEQQISEYLAGYRPEEFYQVYTFKSDLNAEISEILSMGALNSITDAVAAAENNSTFYKGTAKEDGIVVYYTDGFEAVTADNFTPEMFDKSSYKKINLKDRTKIEAGTPACKLISDENWNLIIPIADDMKRQIADASAIRVKFKKDNTIMRLPFVLKEKDGVTYLIFSLSNSMVRFATDRYLEVELLFDEESGLKIPNSSITKKDFFTVPMEYFQKGDNSSKEGIMIRKTAKNGDVTDSFVTPDIYFATEYAYYVDDEEMRDGDVVLKPNSDETYTVHETAKLEGVYCINKGYAVFRQIDVIYQNGEYSIIRNGTEYGVALYDHIALNGDAITENVVVKNK